MSKYVRNHELLNDGSHTLRSLSSIGEVGIVVYRDTDSAVYNSHEQLLRLVDIAPDDSRLVVAEITELPAFFPSKLDFALEVRPLLKRVIHDLNINGPIQ